jgi:transposase
MFFRQKRAGAYRYLQIVENHRENGKVRQRTLMTLGRLDVLQDSGQMDGLMRSGLRFCRKLAAIDAGEKGQSEVVETIRIGPDLVFGRLWERLGMKAELQAVLKNRRYEFDVERAIYLTVLHRLFVSGSDRSAEKWRRDYRIPGTEALDLHHLYRAMAFLGEALPKAEQGGKTPFAPRCTKDVLEERLFARRRDLFTDLQMVFFDTTSIYFEGEGGQLGEYGNSKDHRPDLKQMVVGVVLDSEGRPLCCEMWPGNTTDVTTLLPVVKRLQKRFGIGEICIVSDRGMISQKTIEELEKPKTNWKFILGARMRNQKEVRDEVLSRAGAYQTVHPARLNSKDLSPLKVKDVRQNGNRYVVCLNEAQRKKDAFDREAIVDHLRAQLKRGEKTLVGNKGYRKYLKGQGEDRFAVDEEKVAEEARYDGKWVLRTNLDLSAREIALKYKQLWMVEQIFRTLKSILETRPVFHKCTETIRGHVFCSFLALCLRKKLDEQLTTKGMNLEWQDIVCDLNELQEVKTVFNGKSFVLRSQLKGCAHSVLQAAGVAAPPIVREALQ